MNKYNRRSRPNLRHVCKFYSPSTVINDSGEVVDAYSLHYTGPFSMELPRSPIEIVEAGRVMSEQVFYLIGQWCSPASRITAGMLCVIPELAKVYAVSGPATDQWGDRRKVKINIVDNLCPPYSPLLLP
jgi:hypothetical protein